ncbi:MAG TPA: OsmC family protein [Thermoanaerobaculia bacterium]|nr:OsmC family protein [Thermoanaerobaculia bacterium]HQP85747.1 OsmC family protein [Thermoanaerobaculia bacterium]
MEVRFPGGVAVEAIHAGMTIRTDQPVAAGGAGSAPSPFDLFLVSLSTCAGFYALRFCQERGLPTEGLGVTMDWERSPETKLISKIRISVKLPEGFPEKYRAAILRATDQCAVKKHLVSPPAIEVEAV